MEKLPLSMLLTYEDAPPREELSTEALVRAVRRHAARNYNRGGWDFLVECWSDADIIETIGGARTRRGAIRKCGEVVRAQGGARAEVMAEIF